VRRDGGAADEPVDPFAEPRLVGGGDLRVEQNRVIAKRHAGRFASTYRRRLPTTSCIASAAPAIERSIIGRSRARSVAVRGRDPRSRRRATRSIALTTLADGNAR
jgi:hypothetical protein